MSVIEHFNFFNVLFVNGVIRLGTLFRSFMINILLDMWGAIPAVILLVLHFFLGVPLWFFVMALAGWLVIVGTMTVLMHLITSQPDTPHKQKKNMNPYSKKGYETPDMQR